MKSFYRAELEEKYTGFELLQALHPTPAVGGSPRNQAIRAIESFENFDRGFFAGAVGYMTGKHGDFAIGIRSAILDRRELSIFAGAGIVSESDPKAEWEETEIKMKNFLDIFQPVLD